jgi:hypothetical protein
MKPISYYQNITGESKEHSNRIGSAYWNEGKWKNFIAPLLPVENRKDMTFVEIGTNSGLFLKLAKKSGFRNAIGVEMDSGAVKRGIKHRDSIGMDYKILQREVGKNFSFDELPVADVYLLSNVHYYFQLQDWLDLLDRMYHRTVYCLIITRPIYRAKHHWRPQTTVQAIKYYFREWEQIHAKYRVNLKHMDRKNDPSPRSLQSLIFKSKLNRIKFDDLIVGARGDNLKISRTEIIERAEELYENPDLIPETEYYKAFHKRMIKKWDEKRLYEFVKGKIDMAHSIKTEGLKKPILIGMDYKVIDGGHRVEVLKQLGYDSIITRFI